MTCASKASVHSPGPKMRIWRANLALSLLCVDELEHTFTLWRRTYFVFQLPVTSMANCLWLTKPCTRIVNSQRTLRFDRPVIAMTQPRVLSTGSGFLVGRAHAKNSGLVSGTLRLAGIEADGASDGCMLAGIEAAGASGGCADFVHIFLMRTPSSSGYSVRLLRGR